LFSRIYEFRQLFSLEKAGGRGAAFHFIKRIKIPRAPQGPLPKQTQTHTHLYKAVACATLTKNLNHKINLLD